MAKKDKKTEVVEEAIEEEVIEEVAEEEIAEEIAAEEDSGYEEKRMPDGRLARVHKDGRIEYGI